MTIPAMWMDQRSGQDRRKLDRRKGERRSEGINVELILRGIAIRRSGLDRRHGERRRGERRREQHGAACSSLT